MPSLIHDALVQLFRNRPSLAPDLLRDALQAPVPAFDHVRIGDAALGEIAPTEYRADLVLLLEAESPGGAPPVVPLVVDERDAVEAPELAVLSAMVHGDDPRAAQVGKAAIAGARRAGPRAAPRAGPRVARSRSCGCSKPEASPSARSTAHASSRAPTCRRSTCGSRGPSAPPRRPR